MEEGNLVNFHNVRHALYARKSTYSEANIILFVGEHLHIYIYYTQCTTSTSTGARTKEDYRTSFFCNFLLSIGFLLIFFSLDFFTGFCRHLDPHLDSREMEYYFILGQNFMDATRLKQISRAMKFRWCHRFCGNRFWNLPIILRGSKKSCGTIKGQRG